MTVKLRKQWTFVFDSKRFIWYWTNHYKVQDTRENLKTTTNRPRSIFQYSNIDPRLSGQNCNFFKFPLSFNSQKRLRYKENTTKHRSSSWKPRSHVRTNVSNVAYYRWCLRFNFLTLNWLFPCQTIIIPKYFWYSQFSEFYNNNTIFWYNSYSVKRKRMCSMNDLKANFTTLKINPTSRNPVFEICFLARSFPEWLYWVRTWDVW